VTECRHVTGHHAVVLVKTLQHDLQAIGFVPDGRGVLFVEAGGATHTLRYVSREGGDAVTPQPLSTPASSRPSTCQAPTWMLSE